MVPQYAEELVKENSTLVQWFGKGYEKFYSGQIVKIVKRKGGVTQKWVYFHDDKTKLILEMAETEYMKTWAFVEVAEESQVNEPMPDIGAEADTEETA